jgi:hypothetical protein
MLQQLAKDASAIAEYFLPSIEEKLNLVVEKNKMIEFLNVDVDLSAQKGLDELLRMLDAEFIVLQKRDDRATIELKQYCSELDNTVVSIARLILSLPELGRNLWARCDTKVFNIGIQAGFSPCSKQFQLSKIALDLITKLDAELTITIYPHNI